MSLLFWAGHIDDRISLFANSFMHRWPVFDKVVERLLDAAQLKFGVTMALLCWLWFRPVERSREDRALIVSAVLSGFVGFFVGRLLALTLPFRTRPLARTELDFSLPLGFEPAIRSWSAFPSDHATMAFALAFGIFRISRPLGWFALVHAVLIICLPRLYMGLHHFSDLAFGALIGAGTFVVIESSSFGKRIVAAALAVEARSPAAFYTAAFVLSYNIVGMFGDVRFAVALFLRLLRGEV